MPRQPPNTSSELILEISDTDARKLEVCPRGLAAEIRPFLMEPVLSCVDEWRPLAHPEELGARYYEAIFANQDALKKWLDARLLLGSGRLIIIANSEASIELWETLCTPNNKKPLALQGISIERRLSGMVPPPVAYVLPEPPLRVLWVAPQQPPDSDSGARRIRPLLDDEAIVDCRPPTLQRMMELLIAARQRGRPFHAMHVEGQGFFEFQKEPGRHELYFRNGDHGIQVDIDRLREAFIALPLVVLACTGRIGPPIPVQLDRRFRPNWTADSGRIGP